MSQKSADDKLAAKKAAVLRTSRPNRTPIFAGLAILVLLAGGGFWHFHAKTSSNSLDPTTPTPVAGDVVSMPAAAFDDGKHGIDFFGAGDRQTINQAFKKPSGGRSPRSPPIFEKCVERRGYLRFR